MVALTLRFPDGASATVAADEWQSESAELAATLNAENASQGSASYLPHPTMEVVTSILR